MADLEKITKKRLGELLVAEGLISQDQLAEALKAQEEAGGLIGETLVKLGFTTETEIAKTLCTQFAKPFLKPSKYQIEKEVLGLLPTQILAEHLFVPVDRFGNLLVIAMAGLLDAATFGEIQKLTGCEVEIYIATASDVKQTLRRAFPDLYDPITLLPRFEVTGTLARAAVGPADGTERAPANGDMDELGSTTRDISADEDSDWEALFEEAEKNVMRSLKPEDSVQPPQRQPKKN